MNPKDQIKDALSITDVVSTYIRLEKSGSQFRARCPFHHERTPSFYVSPERKSFHCFGCQQHGDIFTFVEKIENIPFYDAMKILADRAGVSLQNREKNQEESRLVSLLKDATDHFKHNLTKSPEARNYLLERGLTDETIQLFHIGYAKNEWRDLFTFLAQKGYSPEEMELSGLEIKALDDHGKVKGWYDRFRGRVMFPIRNVSGATVGYSGRIMPSLVDPTVAQGKYVNTPETPLYHKSKILFGYDTARKTMAETKQVVVVEGQMDLCMSYQAGVHNTVAVSGTAFTDEHIHIIKRFCDTVILSFDTDSAGQNAFKKTALLCLLGGLDVYAVGAIGTKDPADLIRENPLLWHEAIAKKEHVVIRVLSNILDEVSDERIQGKRIVDEVLPFIRAINSPVDKDHFLRKVSERAHISYEILYEELGRVAALTPKEEETVVVKVSKKERAQKELIAYATLMNLKDHKRYVALKVDETLFPEALIQEAMFKIEEMGVKKNDEKYFLELVASYEQILHEEKIAELLSRQKEISSRGGGDEEVFSLLKEIDMLKRAKRESEQV